MTADSESKREQALDEAIALYLRELDAGRRPNRKELAARHPELAKELEEFFSEQDRFEQAIAPLRPAAEAASLGGAPLAGDPLATTVSSRSSSSAHPGLPELTAYELLEPIARGGMAVVWKARDRKLNRLVALKFVLAGAWATPVERQRFRNEAESAAQLDHPHIVPIYEVGEADGQAFLSMKLLEGGALVDRLDHVHKDPDAAARLLVPVARAVHYAHQRGILHRDLKPANVLLDADGQPYVTDFGLAKRVGANAELTQSGAVLGTPAYMAPEQAAGRHEAVTTASDVYGLGGILYALLTGRAPFRGDSVLTTLEQVKNQPPEPPRKSNPAVAKDLELICLKCLSKEAHRRYASAEALANELERYLDGKPLLLTRPVGNAERTLRWCLRNPAVAALTTGIALALVIVATVSTVAYFQLRAANEQERASRERAEKNLAVARDAVAYFAKVTEDPQMQKRGLEKLREQMRTRAKDFYVQLTAHQPDDPRLAADQGRAFVALGRMEFLLGSPRQAIGAHRQAQAIFERLVQQHPGIEEFEEGLARSLLEQGALFQITQQMVEARQVLSRAVEIQERLFNWQPSKLAYQQGLARAYFELGRLHQVNRQPEKARAVYEEALMRFKPVAESHPEAEYQAPLARTHINLGTVYALPALAQLPEAPANGVQAARHYAAAQDILEKLDKENAECQCLLAEAHHLIGRMLRDSDRPRDMNVHFESALAILGGLTHKYTDVPDYQFRLGAMYHAQGFAFVLLKQLDRAASSYEKAAAATEALVREYDLPDYQRELGALCYDRACLAGLSAAALKDSPLAPAEREQKLDQLTQEACEQLGKSWDSGFLQSERIFAHFKGDTDLNPLRGRDDFEKLVVEFEKQQRAKSPPAPR